MPRYTIFRGYLSQVEFRNYVSPPIRFSDNYLTWVGYFVNFVLLVILSNEKPVKIEKISWDEETVLHIARHSVSPEEVEEVLFNDDDPPIIMRGKEGRYLAYGKTQGGRFLLVVWILQHKKTGIITARDLTIKEKQFYRRSKK